MARRSRNDTPEAWFHIMNRGIARRTLFEWEEDMRVFLGHLGEACDRGEIEVHAFCLMTTHYHLLARSPIGQLGVAMQRVQTEYSRQFNRGRRRDGPLVRGRYMAKEIDSHAYQCAVVSYIDRNPVSAGLVVRAEDYPYGSAKIYAQGRGEECLWLERGWIENEVCQELHLPVYDPARYSEVFAHLSDELARIVELRLRSRVAEDPIDDLIRAARGAVVEWMKRKAQLADGSQPGLPVLAPESVEQAIRVQSCNGTDGWMIGRRSGWRIVHVGLCRQLCGLGLDEVGARAGLGRSATSATARLHMHILLSDDEYARRTGLVASQALGIWKRGGK